jgi:Family of unknown function (DUF6460)
MLNSVDRGQGKTMANNAVERFIGGSPAAALVRLVLLSILVGVVLSAFGFDPWNILPSIKQFFISIWNMGFDAVRWVWRYFLLGAIIVIPIWLIVRLMGTAHGR